MPLQKFADTHNDLLMLVTRRPRERWGSYFRTTWLPQLHAGQIAVQVLAIYVDHKMHREAALREILRMIEAAHVIADENPDAVRLCTTGEQVRTAIRDGRIALILAIEGCGSIAPDLELVSTMHRLDVRMISLVHMGRNAFADGSDEDDAHAGLSRLGRDLIEILNDLGIIIDISHLNARGVDDVFALTTRPVIASHSAARSLRDHHRNLTDEQLRQLANRNGFISVNFMASYLNEHDANVRHLVDHIDYIRSIVGTERVGLGADFVAEVFREIAPATTGPGFDDFDPIATIPGLEGPAGMPLVADEMHARGWPESDVMSTCLDNVLNFFDHELV